MLDLEISASDPVRLVPVYLGLSDGAVFQADASDTLALSPPTPAMALSKAGDFPNGSANSEGLGMRDVANDLKVHRAPIFCRLTYAVTGARPRAHAQQGGRARVRVDWNDTD
ncbi:MAG: hypothetical protein WAO95_11840 [Burkholderiales bacterium]